MNITRAGLLLGAACLTAVLFAPGAHAATISVSGSTAVLIAGPGEANDVLATTDRPTPDRWALNVADGGAPLHPGPGCGPHEDAAAVSCTNVDALIVWAGDGDDRVRLDDRTGFPGATMYGQVGHDLLSVSSSIGSSPLLDGGSGNDTLRANMNSGGDVPLLRGGSGGDSLELLQVDGGRAFGGSGDDRIVSGTDGGNALLRLDGEGGNDTYTFLVPFRARPGALVPGSGFDTLDESSVVPNAFLPFEFDMAQCPAGCVEQVVGTAGDDVIRGDARSQTILGGDGNDALDGGGGRDLLSGQEGDDSIEARDGALDTVACDGGMDTVFADRIDLVGPDCESITRGRPRV